MHLVEIKSAYYNFDYLVSAKEQEDSRILLKFSNDETIFISKEEWEEIKSRLDIKFSIPEEEANISL